MKNIFAVLLAALGLGGATQAPGAELSGDAPVTQDLRSMVFALKPSDIGLDATNHTSEVWGVVMETGLDSGFYTLVVLADGTSSLYFSTGGGIIGAGEHASVRSQGEKFLAMAGRSLPAASIADSHPAPSPGQTTFYFLTYAGLKSYSAKEEDLGEHRDKLSELFHQAHAVIATMRDASGG
jgi:hypothetical protein